MLFSTSKIVLALSAGVLVSAGRRWPAGPPGPPANCLTPQQAHIVANGWAESIANYSKGLVEALVTPDFTEYTESALSLNSECLMAPVPGPDQANPDLNAPIWTNRTTFELLQGSSAPFQAKILNVWNNCDTVIMRWSLTDTGSRPVIGIIVMETVPVTPTTYDGVEYAHQIKHGYYEFDNEAWIQNQLDAGICKDPITGKPKPKPKTSS